MKKNSKISKNMRCWLEIDLEALSNNAREISLHLPQGCQLMAVVKTDAYGLGIEQVSKKLSREGIKSFAVASVDEGVALRRFGIKGNILVLGYTHFSKTKILSRHNLEQLVVDGAHAKALCDTGHKLKIHAAIDTGMHRLGIEPKNFEEIESIFHCKNLTVVGVASHLASSDSSEKDDVDFTNLQIKRFYETVGALQEKGYDVGKLHIQSSYGLCNYPHLQCDYTRVGIMLYGAINDNCTLAIRPLLRPVFSLYAKIVQVREIDAGESVSYGRIYTTDKPTTVAVVSIGYADGVPRHMSANGGFCIVNGVKVPIIGRIAMDFLMIDVTMLDLVAPGDTAILIGKDGKAEISCEEFAAASQTIAHDILTSLGKRVKRIYL